MEEQIMRQEHYRQQYQDALSKAFAARASNVRLAYFDLANFYHEKLGGHAQVFATHEDLQRSLTARKRAA